MNKVEYIATAGQELKPIAVKPDALRVMAAEYGWQDHVVDLLLRGSAVPTGFRMGEWLVSLEVER